MGLSSCIVFLSSITLHIGKTIQYFTRWGRVTHICVGNLTIIGADNGLSPGRRQAIIWNNAGILLNGPWGTNFCEILIGIQTFSFKKMHLKMSSAKWRRLCLGLNVLIPWIREDWCSVYVPVNRVINEPDDYLHWCWTTVNWTLF